MTAEKLSEALSFIDDDIIEETENARSRKDTTDYKIIWLRCLAVAACLCIALVAVLAGAGRVDIPLKGEPVGDGTTEDIKYGVGSAGGAVSGVNEGLWYYVEITRWEDDGFYGIIRGCESEGGIIPVGEKVKIKFADTVWIIKNTEESAQKIFGRLPDEKDFPAGSLIKAELFGSKTSDGKYCLRTAYLGELAPWETEPAY